MSQSPAYTAAEVITAGMTMRARGVEPERGSLWTELGRRGLSKTPWDAWLKHRDQQLPARAGIELDGEQQTPALTTAIEGQNRALATIIACARAEAEAPLRERLEVLEKALSRESAERRNLERLADDLETELAARDAVITSIQKGPSLSRLILPGRS